MKVCNFQIQEGKAERIFFADFVFDRPFGLLTKKERVLFLLKRVLLHPRKFWREGRSVTKTVWISVPRQYAITDSAEESFFLLAFGLAIFLKEDLFFDGVISPELIQKIPELKEYFDYGSGFKFSVMHRIGMATKHERSGEAQFFTLGVDSFTTLIASPEAVKQQSRHLVYVDGFDVPLRHAAFLKKIHKRITHVAQETGNTAVFVQSNVREISDKIIGWGQYHVSALAAVSILLPFRTMSISGETFDAPDWGLRFGVEKLFSTPSFSLQLVGHNVRRDISVKKLQQSPFFDLFLQNVRVCWANVELPNLPYNCGACQKCLRTQLTLLALGCERTPTFGSLNKKALHEVLLNKHVYEEWLVLRDLFAALPQKNWGIRRELELILKKPLNAIPPAYKTHQF